MSSSSSFPPLLSSSGALNERAKQAYDFVSGTIRKDAPFAFLFYATLFGTILTGLVGLIASSFYDNPYDVKAITIYSNKKTVSSESDMQARLTIGMFLLLSSSAVISILTIYALTHAAKVIDIPLLILAALMCTSLLAAIYM